MLKSSSICHFCAEEDMMLGSVSYREI